MNARSAKLAVLVLTAAVLTGVPAEAQSFGGEVLSPRVLSDYVYAHPAPGVVAADPRVDHPLVAVLLWRGQSGWQTDTSRTPRQRPSVGSAMSVGASSMTEHSHIVGGRDLAFRYDNRRHMIQVLGQSYDASEPVAILIDRVDTNGGPPQVVGVVKLSKPFVLPARWSDAPGASPAPPGALLAKALRQYPEIDAFLR
jgi:hypothetical protein